MSVQDTVQNDHSLQPLLDVIQLGRRYGVDLKRGPREIGEYKHHIELLQAELYTFQTRNLDIGQRNDHERGIGEMDQAFGRGLELDIGTEGNTFKGEFTEGDIDVEVLARLSLLVS